MAANMLNSLIFTVVDIKIYIPIKVLINLYDCNVVLHTLSTPLIPIYRGKGYHHSF